MAIFFADMKVFSRAKGHSAVAAAAYRSGLRIVDQRTGVAHDYRRRHGVVAVNMFAPHGAPEWARDPSRLFVEAELTEGRVNSRAARELQVALPFELDSKQRAALVAELARTLVRRYGVAVLAATHEPSGKGDERNVHTHFLFTTRSVTSNGFGPKVRILDEKKRGAEEVQFLRAKVAELTNAALAAAGVEAPVDHRRLTVQAAEAEARGDIVQAVLLTRAVIRTEGKAGTAARRRREHTPRTLRNDMARHDTRVVLAHFLAKAKSASRVTPRSPRIDLGTARWTEPGRGPGTRVINLQGQRARRARQSDEAAVLRWLDMLERERVRIAEAGRKMLAAYAVAMRLKRADVRSLVDHGEHDPRCFDHLGRVLAARRTYLDAAERTERAREEHGQAMAATAAARKAVEDESTAPPIWRPVTRRAWAEHRRRQRAAQAAAEANEKASLKAVANDTGIGSALDEWQCLAAERRRRFPVPGDPQPDPENAATAPGKIGNKIPSDHAGVTTRKPAPSYRPTAGRRRRAPTF